MSQHTQTARALLSVGPWAGLCAGLRAGLREGLCATLTLTLLGAPLLATPSTEPDHGRDLTQGEEVTPDNEAGLEQSRAHLSEALKLIKAKDLRSAITQLDLSYRAHPSVEVLHLLARVYDRFPDECLRSLASWRQLIESCGEGCELNESALANLKRAELECEGALTVTTEPRGVELFIDDQPVGVTPTTIKLMGGTKRVYFFKAGYQDQRAMLQLDRKWGNRSLSATLTSQKALRGEPHSATQREATQGEIEVIKVSSKPDSADVAPPSAPTGATVTASTAPTPPTVSASSVSTASVSTATVSTASVKPSLTPQPQAEVPSIEGFFGDQQPYIRLESPAPIRQGKVAMAGGLSLVADLRCEYLNRFKRYIPLERCDHARMKLFDRFYLALQPSKGLYVYVIMSNDHGQWQLIYPVPGEDNLLKAGRVHSVPQGEWVLFDQLKDITDRVTVLASPTPLSALELHRGELNQSALPVEVMRYFVPMGKNFMGARSVQKLRSDVQSAQRSRALHITFEVLR